MTSRDEAIATAGAHLAAALADADDQDPRTAAEAAWVPGGLPVPAIEARIRARRAMGTPVGGAA